MYSQIRHFVLQQGLCDVYNGRYAEDEGSDDEETEEEEETEEGKKKSLPEVSTVQPVYPGHFETQ